MAAYVMANVEVLDPDRYREYPRRNTATVERYGGKFIARGGKVDFLEGDTAPDRLVIIEFPSVEAARAWYNSPEYQEILPIRQKHARTHLLAIVEGATAQ